jgi:hypothetical protein
MGSKEIAVYRSVTDKLQMMCAEGAMMFTAENRGEMMLPRWGK